MPLGLDSSVGKNQVAIVAGNTRHVFGGNSSSRNGESRDGLCGTDEGIMKKTEFSLDSHSIDGAVGWFDGNRKHEVQEAFNQV